MGSEGMTDDLAFNPVEFYGIKTQTGRPQQFYLDAEEVDREKVTRPESRLESQAL
jgi:hypothetical protein